MFSVTPEYRTERTVNANETVFTLYGVNFDLIGPDDKGWISGRNDNPTIVYGQTGGGFYQLELRVIDSCTMEAYYPEAHAGMFTLYLGAIGDGVNPPVWVNNSQPLP